MKAAVQKTRSVGILLLTRPLLEEYRSAGICLAIRSLGMVIIDPAVTPELARETIHSLDLTGVLLGWKSMLRATNS
jgi:hypothetical protein